MMEFGTDANKSLGVFISLSEKCFIFWILAVQVEFYAHPKDWGFDYWQDFGVLSIGPIVFNWSDDD